MHPTGIVELSAEKSEDVLEEDDPEPVSSSSLTGKHCYFNCFLHIHEIFQV